MIEKEKLDNFLKEMNIEVMDYQKDILLKMLNDPDRYKVLVPRASGYSAAKWLSAMFGVFLSEVERARTICLIDSEIKSGAKLSPTLGGKPMPLLLDKVICNFKEK